jgi:hypothetical protein
LITLSVDGEPVSAPGAVIAPFQMDQPEAPEAELRGRSALHCQLECSGPGR